MYSQQITAEMATVHRHDLIAAAEANRLARQVRRSQQRGTTSRRRQLTWLRWTTRPAHV